MDGTTVQRCFLLTHSSRDTVNRFDVELHAINDSGMHVHITVRGFRPLFFVLRSVSDDLTAAAVERKALPLKTMSGADVDCCYFRTLSAMRNCAERLHNAMQPLFESDIHPVDRYLMERSVNGGFEAVGPAVLYGKTIRMTNPRIRGLTVQPVLSVLSLDIETNVSQGVLYSIACAGKRRVVFIVGKSVFSSEAVAEKRVTFEIVVCRDENELLIRFLSHLEEEDPDIIIGWNVIDFDMQFIAQRCIALSVPFAAGREKSIASIFRRKMKNRTALRIDGRVVMDVPTILRTYHRPFEEYSLNFVASELLGKTKDITVSGAEKIAAIDTLYANDPVAFCHYNMEDCLLTREIFDITDTLPNAIERSYRSGHLLDRCGGSIAAFDYLYLPRLHRAGYVAPDAVSFSHSDDVALPGGYVIEPHAGIYDNVLVFDFRSLYPSIIMSFGIDPLGYHIPSDDRIQGPAGPSFSRKPAILPGIIGELLDARIQAKRNNNPHLSQAIKILMNSFYGVLGARTCRFFSTELASTITRTGQYILKTSIDFIVESTSYPVIYGDTDSLFVHLGPHCSGEPQAIGMKIAADVTAYLGTILRERFNADCALLLQFETHFTKFLIPAIRGTSYGSKKHYCGAKPRGTGLDLFFKGMESVRSDWTELAKEFQYELIRRIFLNEPLEEYVRNTVTAVISGCMDDKLVYKKRLRKRLEEYTQGTPPHVAAARMLDNPPHLIKYCQTIDGPQPLEKLTSRLDYNHYIDSQLQPIADSVLELTSQSFSRIVSGQQELFGE